MRRADDDVLMNAEDVTLSMAPRCQVGKMDRRGRKNTDGPACFGGGKL